MNQNTIAKISNILPVTLKIRRNLSQSFGIFISTSRVVDAIRIRKILLLVGTAFCLLTSYLACERDFSAVGEKKTPPASDADTTSHNFVWTIDTFGIGGRGSSYLLDVSVINENDIWAVGEIHTAETDTFDSLGNWVPPYNAVRWNGQEWELKRILYQGGFWTIRSIFAFSSYDVWFGAIVKWNGLNFIEMPIPGIFIGHSISKMWGKSANDLYVAGTEGLIAHSDGSSWQELQSGTTVDLLDVWGSPDGSVVWACGYTDFEGTVLLKITGLIVELVYEDIDNWFNIRPDSISGVLTGLWTNEPSKLHIITPAGMYVASSNTHGEAQRIWTENNFLPGFPRALRGQSSNDLFTAGDFSFMAHYNGASWHIYNRFAGRIRSRGIAITKNLVVLAGLDIQSNRATIIRGER